MSKPTADLVLARFGDLNDRRTTFSGLREEDDWAWGRETLATLGGRLSATGGIVDFTWLHKKQ